MPRFSLARRVLRVACFPAILAPWLPLMPDNEVIHPLISQWRDEFLVLFKPGPLGPNALGGLASLLVFLFLYVFLFTSPWLTEVYARSPWLRWIARLVAGGYAGLLVLGLASASYYIPVSGLIWLACAALLHFIGLCLIRAEAMAA